MRTAPIKPMIHNIDNLIYSLRDIEREELRETMLNAALLHENGGDWRELFRRKKARHLGRLKKLYTAMYESSTPSFNQGTDELLQLQLPDPPAPHSPTTSSAPTD